VASGDERRNIQKHALRHGAAATWRGDARGSEGSRRREKVDPATAFEVA
jgi:hypothetical protein